MLDSNKDGRFTLEELEQFAIFYSENTKKSNRYEYQYQIQAQCTFKLWQSLQDHGPDEFAAWVGRLLYENSGVNYIDTVPDVPFVKIQTVKLLYDIMDLKLLGDFTLQTFFNLLQQSAEEKQILNLKKIKFLI